MAHKILTIGRKLGSGGRELGERVAESLGIPFFDQNLISMAAERGDLAESYLARFDEKKHNPWMYEMVTGGNKHVPKGESLQEALFKLQGDVIRHISKKTDAVIIGRCADYILRERTDARVLSVFVTAPMEECIRRKMEQKNITEKEAEALIKKVNKDRRKYYEFHTGKDWSAPESYDIYLDSSRQSTEEMTEVLVKRFNEL